MTDDGLGPTIDPLATKLAGKPNEYLLVPEGAESAAEPHARVAWRAGVDPDRLYQAWLAAVQGTPRVEITAEDGARSLLSGQARSAVFRFVDVFAVRILHAPAKGSAAAVYSRSLSGYHDFGVNKRRVEAWRSRVTEMLAN